MAPPTAVRDLLRVAEEVEDLGYDELWVVEDCFLHGGITSAASALAVTDRLHVGAGLLPATVRNPAILAMELATLAHLHPRRFSAALGHGVEAWMRQIGARPIDRVAALTEIVTVVGQLLHGETVTHDGGYVHLDGVRLADPPEVAPPILIGSTGNRGIAVAAKHADGLLLPEGAGEAAVRWASALLGADRKLVVYAWLRIEDDDDDARRAMLPTVRAWLDLGLYPRLAELSDCDRGATLDESLVSQMAIAGSPLTCADCMRRLAAAGANSVVLVPTGDHHWAQVTRFSQDVMPLLLGDQRET